MVSALQIAGLTREYRRQVWRSAGQRPALAPFSLEVEARQFVVVIGGPGSGKSTLLRLLAGADVPTAGSFAHPGIEARHIGSLLQDDALSWRHTIAENIEASLRRRRPDLDRRAAARLAAHALDLLQLTPLAREMPQNVGTAERQRALLARALAAEPKLLILDEPFSHQDDAGRNALARTLRDLHDMLGTTTILATRSSAAALPLADLLAVLHEGQLRETGDPSVLYEAPAHAGTAALLGPVNRLAGGIIELDDDIATVRLTCGPKVLARIAPHRADRQLSAGSLCTVCVRPERIAIAAATAEEMGDDALDAIFIAARFAGATTRLHLLIGTGQELIIDRPSAAGMRGLSPGAPAAIAWQPHHALAYLSDPQW
jgi:ABC-type Fe3+/spermidine/putrescine transport system ATPase subunit